MRILFIFSVLVCALQVNAQTYIQEKGDSINPRVYASVGLFFPNITTSLRIDSDRGLGTELGLEDDFKFDDLISVFNIQGVVRVKNRSQFVLAFTNMSRSSNIQLDDNIEIGDTAFYVGANLDMKFDVNYYALTWRYSFFNNANWSAGLSFGLRAAQFIVKADAEVNGREYGESASVVAPAPLIGLHGSGYLTERLLARYSLEYFTLNVEGIDLNILESRASLEYFILENVGIGAAYSTSRYRVREFPLSDDFEGSVLFDFSGGNLFLSARF
jgi:hypothetical protein